VFPSPPQNDDRDPWGAELSREIARSAPGRSKAGVYNAVPESAPASPHSPREDTADGAEDGDIQVVPVRRQLSVAVAGFAALLAVGLILGAQTSGPDARIPYAIVVFGVQLLFVLAWTMAMRPPAPALVAAICVAAGAVADYTSVTSGPAHLVPLVYVACAALVPALAVQGIRAADRQRARDSLGATLLLVLGVVVFASLIVLTRKPIGTQSVLVCLAAAGVSVLVARLTDAVFARPRIAPQVPRGATGIVLGAMFGTLAAAGLGSVLVLPFTPAKGAVVGLVAAALAVLVDLAVNYAEAGRSMAGAAPTFWVARHMQGPLGAFAVAAPVAYALTVFYLS
jgi:hypothetical protein